MVLQQQIDATGKSGKSDKIGGECADTVVDALLALVAENGGKLPGNKITLLYSQNERFKSIIADAGGLKKFCEKYGELEFHCTAGGPGPGWIQAHVSAQDVVDALLASMDEHGGKIPGNQLGLLYVKNARFRTFVEAAGGIKKFCAEHRHLEFVTMHNGPGWVQARAKEVCAQDVVEALLRLADEQGGRLAVGRVSELYKQQPRFKTIVDNADGLKSFCSMHRELEFISTSGGHDWIKRQTAEASASDAVDAILALVEKHGGKLAGAQLQSLYSKNMEFRTIIRAAGGPKKFCAEHSQLEFKAADGSCGWIQRAAPGIRQTMPVNEIRWTQDCIKIRFRGGKLLVDTLQELIDDPKVLERLPVLDVVERKGKFFAVNGNRRLWVLKQYGRLQSSGRTVHLRVPVRVRGAQWASMSWVQQRFTTQTDGVNIRFVRRYHLSTKERFLTMAAALAAEGLQGGAVAAGSGECKASDNDADDVSTDTYCDADSESDGVESTSTPSTESE
eukprot:gnl/TRDRNA2_/TRDRNA2_182374_c0_seq1.p1 gnl/TRDRNA2_/TRDRNA2_182374_c0~~gnl/TRDRNA2_/TRDRNA2_182374_c0_seq1.p1  ORF type:complete len:504 (-),score=97.56 gnl/TRDRNA2_/TRDRNA2_182374_c0_seq1:491-2002(-)